MFLTWYFLHLSSMDYIETVNCLFPWIDNAKLAEMSFGCKQNEYNEMNEIGLEKLPQIFLI